jgi:hypothetical protein
LNLCLKILSSSNIPQISRKRPYFLSQQKNPHTKIFLTTFNELLIDNWVKIINILTAFFVLILFKISSWGLKDHTIGHHAAISSVFCERFFKKKEFFHSSKSIKSLWTFFISSIYFLIWGVILNCGASD